MTAADGPSLGDELYELALQYMKGTTQILKNTKKSLALFEQAAGLGHGAACMYAGMLYQFGAQDGGIRKDGQKAFEYYSRARKNGFWISEAYIADIFLELGQLSGATAHWQLFFEEASKVALQLTQKELIEIGKAGHADFSLGRNYCIEVGAKHLDDCTTDKVPKIIWQSIFHNLEVHISELIAPISEFEDRAKRYKEFNDLRIAAHLGPAQK